MLSKNRNEERRLELPTQNLRFYDYLHNFLVGFLGIYILGTIVGIIVSSFLKIGLTNPGDYKETLYLAITNFVVYFLLVFEMLFYNFKTSKDAIIKELKETKSYLIGIIGGIVLIACSILYGFMTSSIDVGTNTNQTEVVQMSLNFPVLSLFAIVIFAPIVEELAYRVGLFNLFSKKYKWLGYLVAIIFFTLIHINFINPTNWTAELIAIPDYLLAAIVLTILYHKYGLAASLTAHITNNLIVFILLFV